MHYLHFLLLPVPQFYFKLKKKNRLHRQKIASVKKSYESVMAQIVSVKMDKLAQIEHHLVTAEQR